VQHLGMTAPTHHHVLGDIEVVAQGVHLSRTPFEVRTPAPDQGVHTDEVLKEYGYSAAAIDDLKKRRVV
jgi:formyl-CoA transferase